MERLGGVGGKNKAERRPVSLGDTGSTAACGGVWTGYSPLAGCTAINNRTLDLQYWLHLSAGTFVCFRTRAGSIDRQTGSLTGRKNGTPHGSRVVGPGSLVKQGTVAHLTCLHSCLPHAGWDAQRRRGGV